MTKFKFVAGESPVIVWLLAKAEKEAANQKNDTTGLRKRAARISSRLSSGGF